MDLTPVQARAIELYILPKEDGSFRTIQEVMDEVKRSHSAWYRWLKEPEFKTLLLDKLDSLIDITVAKETRKRLSVPKYPLPELNRLYLARRNLRQELALEGEVQVNVKWKDEDD